MKWGKIGLFVGGVLFGTAGVKILTSREAKKVYAYTTAAALRAKDEEINEKRAADAECEVIEDASAEEESDKSETEAEEV